MNIQKNLAALLALALSASIAGGQELKNQDGSPVATRFIAQGDALECNAEWNQTCERDAEWVPPTGLDLCNFGLLQEEKSDGGAKWFLNFANPRKLSLYLLAKGGRNELNRERAWVKVRMVNVNLIGSNADPVTRTLMQCAYPPSGSIGTGPATRLEYTPIDQCLPQPEGGPGFQLCKVTKIENGKSTPVGLMPCGVCVTRRTP